MNVAHLIAIFTFLSAFIGLYTMVKAKEKGVKSRLIIIARKSDTGAILLGGLVVFVTTTIGMIALNAFDQLSYYHFFTWGVSGSILVALGYLDDLKEIRPFAKLGGQFVASYIFANFCGFYLQDAMSMIFFNAFFFLGFAVFNGSNLIDGVDTISAKTSIVSYSSYFALGYINGIDSLQNLAVLFIAPMAAFWWFNRSPSKIHLGEIGGGIIGLSMLFLSFVTYNSFTAIGNFSIWQNAHMAACGLLLPVAELGVSFLRRLYAGRSPFNGDKMHLHHILMNKYHLKPKNAATVVATAHAMIQSTMLFISAQGSPIMALWVGASSYVAFQIIVCASSWRMTTKAAAPLHYLMDAVKQKNVLVVPADMMDEISFDFEEKSNDQKIKEAA